MKKILSFLKQLFLEFEKNELLYMSSELTYKLILALFPFLMYLINLLTFLGLKYQVFESTFVTSLPDSIKMILNFFLGSVTNFAEQNSFSSIMNFTLLFAIISSASGFTAVIRGVNRTYGVKDERGFIHLKLLSLALVFIFTLTLIISSVFFVFIDVFANFLLQFNINIKSSNLLNTLMLYVPTLFILLGIMLVYKLSSYKKIKLIKTLPGSIVTVVAWIISSYLYNFYINNFSKYSTLYGVIGSFIIFMLWLNVISVVILLGSQINALLEKKTDERSVIKM